VFDPSFAYDASKSSFAKAGSETEGNILANKE
jgi:hypothetical protein